MIRRRLSCLVLLGALCFAAPVRAEPPIEYQLQAAYVSKFLRFVQWPKGAVEPGEFVVGVLGDGVFWEAMRALDGHSFSDVRVKTVRVEDPAKLAGIQVLVVDPSRSTHHTQRFLQKASTQPILTVGQSQGFADAGGIIRFVPVDDTLRFDINTDAANQAGLKVSSRLLRLARNQR